MAINPRARRQRLDRPRAWFNRRVTPPDDATSRATLRRPNDSASGSSRQSSGSRRDQARIDSDQHADGFSSSFDAIIKDFSTRWESGEPVRAEDYFGQLPPAAIAELIYQEYCLAEADNLAPDPSDYLQRFPDHSDSLIRLFALHDVLSVTTLRTLVEPGGLPDVGDEIGPYLLLRELGRGAFARVFLAEQADLGDRLVVVKVATRSSAEPTLLARARHANIVEVLRHTEADDGALHLVCMPFLGGATLGAVLNARTQGGRPGRSRLPRSGRQWLDDLDRVAAPEYPTSGLPRPAREVVGRLSYPQAQAWMIARLAEALDHAERRGVTHGDIKPSNILITADGMPMLFDFNLAVDWHATDSLNPGADLGGTLAYMAPERLRALGEPVVNARARCQPDRHRADLYALGLVLAEALTGEPPAVPNRRSDDPRQFASGLARLRAESFASPSPRSKTIPPAIRAILARCLAPNPSDRYARGTELAEDLDRWRSDRPLVYASEPTRSSWIRRLRLFRFPILALALTVTAAIVVGAVAWSILRGTQRDQALAKWSYILDRTDGVFKVRRFGQWESNLAGDPIELANRHLDHYDVSNDPRWRDRNDVRLLPERERGELEAWVLEQIFRKVVALSERPDSPRDWDRALNLLDQAISDCPATAFRNLRSTLQARLGRKSAGLGRVGSEVSPASPPGWLEAYLAGVAAESLRAREALGHYLDALRLRPDLFWGHYRAAVVAIRIDEYQVACRHLQECLARRPDNKMLHTQLAALILKLELDSVTGSSFATLDDAESESDRALQLDPDFAEANYTRTLIRQAAGQTEGVRRDIHRFSLLTRATNPTDSLALRFVSRFNYGPNVRLQTDADEALLRQALIQNPTDEVYRILLARDLGSTNRTAEAIEQYDQILSISPDHLHARFQRAVYNREQDYAGTIAEMAALIDHPRFEETFREHPSMIRAYHHVATDLLKKEKFAEAEAIAQRGLMAVRQSRSLRDDLIAARKQGGEEIAPEAESYYLLARINAAAAETEPELWRQVETYLRDAFTICPTLRRKWFPGDRVFQSRRVELLQAIDKVVDQ